MNWITKRKIILASGSPRRAELLKQAGFKFEIRPMEVDEGFSETIPVGEVAVHLAEKKASAQRAILKEGELLITADTVVILDQIILGKPEDSLEAKRMLKKLSNNKHQVITGVCLLSRQKMHSFSNCSVVHMKKLSDAEIDYYVENYKPFDKAGSYGIQEWIGTNRIDHIEGSYTNIMGLPTAALYEALMVF